MEARASGEKLSQGLVGQYMHVPARTLDPEVSVEEAARFFLKYAISAAPVVDKGGKLLGVLADDDLMVEETQLHIPTIFTALGEVAAWPPAVRRFEEELRRYLASTVGEAMTTKIVSTYPSDTIEHAATLMHDHHLRMLPVVEGDKVVGVLGRRDLLRALLRR